MNGDAPAGPSYPRELTAEGERLKVRVADVRQLFHPFDAAPLPERDLDPRFETFLVEWGRELPRHQALSLSVRVEGPEGPDDQSLMREGIRRYFSGRALSARRRLKQLFRTGRVSLLIGLAVLALFTAVGRLIGGPAGDPEGIGVLRESLAIGGWVAMWRPLEIFLYDWWPIRAEARLFDRLAAMTVEVSSSLPAPDRRECGGR